MLAIVVDSGREFALREVDFPVPTPSEALIRVGAVSLNRGEAARALVAKEGTRLGWDLAGVVERQAADGSGPPAGSRVAGLVLSKGWAEFVSVPTSALAPIPNGVTLAQAACLPVAGLTALYALRRGGNLLGRRVLITGATGGVGHFACQLARQAGAHVVAAIRSPAEADQAMRYGAHEVAVGGASSRASPLEVYDVIVESVGGASLSRSLGALAKGGVCVVFGASEKGETVIDAKSLYIAGSKTVTGLALFDEIKGRETAGQGLAILLSMVADSQLIPEIAIQASWSEVNALAEALLERRHKGKAVLLINPRI